MNKLWSVGSGHIKHVHQVVVRLRTYFVIECPISIEREKVNAYQKFV